MNDLKKKQVKRVNNGTPKKSTTLHVARLVTRNMHLANKGSGLATNFAIKGSTAMAIHGAKVTPGDIDIVADDIRQGMRALKPLGYKGFNPGMSKLEPPKLKKGPVLPSIDLMHSQEFGEPVGDTRLMYGVRVKTRDALIKDLKLDTRPEKQKRNAKIIKKFQKQQQREQSMQVVLYRPQK